MTDHAVFAGGCFWGIEAAFRKVDGVSEVLSGYAGGMRPNPTYQQVCGGATGHAEAVQIAYDPAVVTYAQLLDVFRQIHDPTQVDGQGPDIGTQYRSAIFPQDVPQQADAGAALEAWAVSGEYGAPVATAIESGARFWPAEEYHQNYLGKGGRCHLPRFTLLAADQVPRAAG